MEEVLALQLLESTLVGSTKPSENTTYFNLSGYLATITSDAENDYVLDKLR